MISEIFAHKERRLWIVSVSLITATLLLFFGGPDYDSPRSLTAFWNLGHIAYFALASYALSKYKPIARRSVFSQWLLILLITLITGILIEVLQYGTHRTPDIDDVIRDLTGSFLFLSFSPIHSKIVSAKKRLALQALASIILLIQLQPFATSLYDEMLARQQFPVLSSFESPFELDRWHANTNIAITHIPAIADGNILQISLSTVRYSGLSLQYFPTDWRNYKALKLSIYNPQTQPLAITCRIHDKQHTQGRQRFDDRYNRSYLLSPGWNTILINLNTVAHAPRNREMDLGQIRGLGIFSIALKKPQTIYLDDILLIP